LLWKKKAFHKPKRHWLSSAKLHTAAAVMSGDHSPCGSGQYVRVIITDTNVIMRK
jgi:hypothetical protein